MYIIKQTITYDRKFVALGETSDLKNLSEKQISSLIERGIVEKIKSEKIQIEKIQQEKKDIPPGPSVVESSTDYRPSKVGGKKGDK